MALSAISSISGYAALQLYRSSPVQGPSAPSRVQPIPRLLVREDSREAELAGRGDPRQEGSRRGEGTASAQVRPALDPRSPEILLGQPIQKKDTQAGHEASRQAARQRPSASPSDAKARLDQLLGQKAGEERKQAEARGARSAEVVAQLAQLKARDAAVRSHEAAHMAAGGRYVTGGASYTYQQGPDGGQYAVGGEVGIDTSSVPGKPEETVQKMRTIRAAALAPSDPSAADIAVAAAAAQAEAQALAEIANSRPEMNQSQARELAGRYAQGPGSTRAMASPGAWTSPRESINMVA